MMRENFDKGFALTVGIEGGYVNDSRDPGGETKYGIAKRYHSDEDIENLTLERAKEIYLNEYWISAGCDNVPFPMDICLFDSQVNPQNDPKWNYGGNQEIMNLKPENWQEYLILRMLRYMRNSKRVFVYGHICRVLKFHQQIKGIL